MFKYFHYIAVFILCSCNHNTERVSNIHREVLGLKTLEQKNNYLESIFLVDQNIRKRSNLLAEGTKEFDDLWKEARVVDSINLLRIDYYIEKHNYPDRFSFSKEALQAPWYVIQHCLRIEERLKFYDILRNQYLNGNLTEIQFYLYLSRCYSMKNFRQCEVANVDSIPILEKIKFLLNELELDPL